MRALRAEDVSEAMIADTAAAALFALGDKRATYRRDNLVDEAQRILAGLRFATPADRITVGERIADQALAGSLDLTPPPLAHTPQRYIRADGTSRLQSRHVYTTPALLDAEDRLLDAAATTGAPIASTATSPASLPPCCRVGRFVCRSTRASLSRRSPPPIASSMCSSARPVPGSPPSWAPFDSVWETDHGPGSVIGLAPSAAAAEVLAEELGAAHREHRQVAHRTQSPSRTTRCKKPACSPAALHPKHSESSTTRSTAGGSKRDSWSSSTKPPSQEPSPSTRSSPQARQAGAKVRPRRRLGTAVRRSTPAAASTSWPRDRRTTSSNSPTSDGSPTRGKQEAIRRPTR